MGRGFLARARGAQLAALPVVLAAVVAAILIACTVQAQSAPTVTSVEISSNAGADNTYALGETIHIKVIFSEAVTVTGTPQILIDISSLHQGTDKAANYAVSLNSGTELIFFYTVVEPNISDDGIGIVANSLVAERRDDPVVVGCQRGADALEEGP